MDPSTFFCVCVCGLWLALKVIICGNNLKYSYLLI